MFYNTGIATYIWVLTNRKPEHRRGKVQLIDATQWFQPLRKNLGSKNCQLSEEDIRRICDVFLDFQETEQSKIFPNQAFGYWKVTVERPLRLAGIDPARAYAAKEIKSLREKAARAEDAPPVIRKVHRKDVEPDPLRGLFPATIDGRPAVVEYEPDTDLRDTEQIPLLEEGGIDAFLRREALPYAPDAWYDPASVKVGYEISFTRYFYKPQPLRPLEEIQADILALERETEGLLAEITVGVHGMTASGTDKDKLRQLLIATKSLQKAMANVQHSASPNGINNWVAYKQFAIKYIQLGELVNKEIELPPFIDLFDVENMPSSDHLLPSKHSLGNL